MRAESRNHEREKCDKRHATDYKVFLWMIVVLALPATLTLVTVKDPFLTPPFPLEPSLDPLNPTPLGYTWSLLLWIIPILAILAWLHLNQSKKMMQKSFWITIALLTPLGFILDLLFGASFFKFPNEAAVLGILVPGFNFECLCFQKELPIEEFIFYITGFIVVLLIYVWCDEYWFDAYNLSEEEYKGELANHGIKLMVFHPRSVIFGIVLITLGVLYKYKLSPIQEGFPGYFIFLVLASVVPTAAFFRITFRFINWRAFSFTFFFILLISLLWEATLASPYGWWRYHSDQMLGLTIFAWTELPVEAVLVWMAVTFTTVEIYEVVKLWKFSGKRARDAFWGEKKTKEVEP